MCEGSGSGFLFLGGGARTAAKTTEKKRHETKPVYTPFWRERTNGRVRRSNTGKRRNKKEKDIVGAKGGGDVHTRAHTRIHARTRIVQEYKQKDFVYYNVVVHGRRARALLSTQSYYNNRYDDDDDDVLRTKRITIIIII